MSLDEPEPVDSVLMFLSGYDTLEYSWVKATAVSVRLQIFIRDIIKYQQYSELSDIYFVIWLRYHSMLALHDRSMLAMVKRVNCTPGPRTCSEVLLRSSSSQIVHLGLCETRGGFGTPCETLNVL